MSRNEIVSSGSEELILVDEQDREIGNRSKWECHEGDGVLHRAFSIFVFNDNQELLLQQRGADKPLWPGFWSNTCCSHPRRGESMEEAVSRRLVQELGFDTPLIYLYKFKYHAQYGAVGSEHEYCWVYYGRYNGPVDANTTEIDDWRFVSIPQLEAELVTENEKFTPWFKMEWAHISQNYLKEILQGREPELQERH